jgi:hypothetical protein
MSSRAILAGLAAAAVSMTIFTEYAVARGGSGGHGGSGGWGGFVHGGSRSAHGSLRSGFGTRPLTRAPVAVGALRQSGASHSAGLPIQPQVIFIRSATAGVTPSIALPIVPPFTVPLVPPFGASVVMVPSGNSIRGPSVVRLPPGPARPLGRAALAGTQPYLPMTVETPWGLTDSVAPMPIVSTVATASEPSLAAAQLDTGTPAPETSTTGWPAACHPVPSGYHCNWPS